MAGTASANETTVSDGLKKLFPQISQLKLLPDAAQHMQFIGMLEQAVMQYLQHVGSQAAAMGTQGGGGAGAGPGAAPPAPPAAQFAPGGASGGGNVGLTAQADPGELQRVLAMAGGQG